MAKLKNIVAWNLTERRGDIDYTKLRAVDGSSSIYCRKFVRLNFSCTNLPIELTDLCMYYVYVFIAKTHVVYVAVCRNDSNIDFVLLLLVF